MTDRDKPVALEARDIGADGRRFSPSAGRNKDVIRQVFAELMPHTGRILEIASGTGEHGAHILAELTELRWTYSDIDAESMTSQRGWIDHLGDERLSGPVTLDTTAAHWGAAESGAPFQGMFCANMIHIAPFEATRGLLRGAGRVLISGGLLMLYGPFARNGEMLPSNAAFDVSLKRRDPSWGVRDLDRDLVPAAAESGLELARIVDMPANNHTVLFRRN